MLSGFRQIFRTPEKAISRTGMLTLPTRLGKIYFSPKDFQRHRQAWSITLIFLYKQFYKNKTLYFGKKLKNKLRTKPDS